MIKTDIISQGWKPVHRRPCDGSGEEELGFTKDLSRTREIYAHYCKADAKWLMTVSVKENPYSRHPVYSEVHRSTGPVFEDVLADVQAWIKVHLG